VKKEWVIPEELLLQWVRGWPLWRKSSCEKKLADMRVLEASPLTHII
jgi:hypothetical protein